MITSFYPNPVSIDSNVPNETDSRPDEAESCTFPTEMSGKSIYSRSCALNSIYLSIYITTLKDVNKKVQTFSASKPQSLASAAFLALHVRGRLLEAGRGFFDNARSSREAP